MLFKPYNLLRICIPEVHELKGIPCKEFKSTRRRYIFSLLEFEQYSGIVHGSRIAIDSPSNDWFSILKGKK